MTMLATAQIQPIAFLDRDGALIFEPTDTFQIDRPDLLKILDGVVAGLQWLQQKGYRLVLVTNQNGLGTAAFPYKNFAVPHEQFLATLAAAGVKFERIFICPHLPTENCDCRKPNTALVDAWLAQQTYDRAQSFMYGDRDTDAEFARRLNIRFVRATINCPFEQSKFTFIK
ncbi:MAG: imidazole glycerol-phosphate dehydratase/histidinol phosphatase [uncultured bacterium]|nr:MAG: imidazole glycerol-phosphate dehydratase/histidinol phosphatase [uncultured bacterium]